MSTCFAVRALGLCANIVACRVGECNNALIYPGLGLGSIVSQSKKMSLQMITAGARRLSELSPALKGDKNASLLPDFEDAPKVTTTGLLVFIVPR